MSGDIPYDAITTFFVFLIGLPAIIFQWLVPEVRQIIVKRPLELLVDAGLPLVIGIGIVTAALTVPNDWAWRWPSTLGGLFALAIFTAFRLPPKYVRRTAVVQRLERETVKTRKGSVSINEASLLDLVELGKQSSPGQDKELVLQALLRLCDAVIADPGYDGDRLAELSIGVLDVTVNGPELGSSQNLATAGEILKHPLRALDTGDTRRSDPFRQTDLLHTMRALSRLGREAIKVENESVSMAVVQALGVVSNRQPSTSVAASRALFEIGVVAVEHKQFLAAMSCAQSLTALTTNGLSSEDIVADTLGLLAHFWTSGTTGRTYADRHLDMIAPALDGDLDTALRQAALHSAQTTQFMTSDKVHAVLAQRGAHARV